MTPDRFQPIQESYTLLVGAERRELRSFNPSIEQIVHVPTTPTGMGRKEFLNRTGTYFGLSWLLGRVPFLPRRSEPLQEIPLLADFGEGQLIQTEGIHVPGRVISAEFAQKLSEVAQYRWGIANPKPAPSQFTLKISPQELSHLCVPYSERETTDLDQDKQTLKLFAKSIGDHLSTFNRHQSRRDWLQGKFHSEPTLSGVFELTVRNDADDSPVMHVTYQDAHTLYVPSDLHNTDIIPVSLQDVNGRLAFENTLTSNSHTSVTANYYDRYGNKLLFPVGCAPVVLIDNQYYLDDPNRNDTMRPLQAILLKNEKSIDLSQVPTAVDSRYHLRQFPVEADNVDGTVNQNMGNQAVMGYELSQEARQNLRSIIVDCMKPPHLSNLPDFKLIIDEHGRVIAETVITERGESRTERWVAVWKNPQSARELNLDSIRWTHPGAFKDVTDQMALREAHYRPLVETIPQIEQKVVYEVPVFELNQTDWEELTTLYPIEELSDSSVAINTRFDVNSGTFIPDQFFADQSKLNEEIATQLGGLQDLDLWKNQYAAALANEIITLDTILVLHQDIPQEGGPTRIFTVALRINRNSFPERLLRIDEGIAHIVTMGENEIDLVTQIKSHAADILGENGVRVRSGSYILTSVRPMEDGNGEIMGIAGNNGTEYWIGRPEEIEQRLEPEKIPDDHPVDLVSTPEAVLLNIETVPNEFDLENYTGTMPQWAIDAGIAVNIEDIRTNKVTYDATAQQTNGLSGKVIINGESHTINNPKSTYDEMRSKSETWNGITYTSFGLVGTFAGVVGERVLFNSALLDSNGQPVPETFFDQLIVYDVAILYRGKLVIMTLPDESRIDINTSQERIVSTEEFLKTVAIGNKITTSFHLPLNVEKSTIDSFVNVYISTITPNDPSIRRKSLSLMDDRLKLRPAFDALLNETTQSPVYLGTPSGTMSVLN